MRKQVVARATTENVAATISDEKIISISCIHNRSFVQIEAFSKMCEPFECRRAARKTSLYSKLFYYLARRCVKQQKLSLQRENVLISAYQSMWKCESAEKSFVKIAQVLREFSEFLTKPRKCFALSVSLRSSTLPLSVHQKHSTKSSFGDCTS